MTMWAIRTYTLPLARPYQWAKGVQRERRGVLANLQQREAGWGEAAPPPHEQGNVAALAVEALAQSRNVANKQPERDLGEAPPRLRHALLGAWLDAQSRDEGVPLNAYLARRYPAVHDAAEDPRAKVPVNALIEATSPQASAALARDAVRRGFRTLKVKSDGTHAGDVARLGAIRDAVGGKARLRLDANESWSPPEAAQRMAELVPFDLDYVEQPLRAGRIRDLAQLMRGPVPVALDESVTSFDAVRPYLAAGCKPTLILKPQRLGGADRTLDVMRQAHRHGLACVVTNSLETAVGRAHALHLASLLPDPLPDCGLATEGHFAADVAAGVTTEGGWQAVPRTPGLGVVPDDPVLE